MAFFLVRRLLQSVVLMAVMSVIIFAGIYLIGNPVDILISPDSDQAEIDRATRALGLDRPLWEQYFVYMGRVLQGDLGKSFRHNVPAIELILERMPATLELAFAALLMAIALGIPLGIVAGLKPDSIVGRTIMAGSIFCFSLPTFWVGLMLIMIFAVHLGWLPSTGRGQTAEIFGVSFSFLTRDGLAHLVLPALNLALFKIALVIRLTRAGMMEVLPMDFVKFARAQGIFMHRVVLVHVLKNVLIPVVTVLGLELGNLIAFSVVTETIFAWPGMGRLVIEAINLLDRPVIVAYLMMTVLMFILINLIVDVLYAVLDPRVRLTQAAE